MPRGEVVEPLDGRRCRRAVRKLVADGVEAIAVCFLFAYANPAHEQAAAADHPRASRPISTCRCRTR